MEEVRAFLSEDGSLHTDREAALKADLKNIEKRLADVFENMGYFDEGGGYCFDGESFSLSDLVKLETLVKKAIAMHAGTHPKTSKK